NAKDRGCPRLAMRWHTPTRRRWQKRTRRSWSASASGHSFVSIGVYIEPLQVLLYSNVARASRPRKACWLAARRARKLFGAAVIPVSMIGCQLKAEHSGNDQAETGHAPHARRFAECQHADGDGSGGANARPHGISGSKGHRLQG